MWEIEIYAAESVSNNLVNIQTYYWFITELISNYELLQSRAKTDDFMWYAGITISHENLGIVSGTRFFSNEIAAFKH